MRDGLSAFDWERLFGLPRVNSKAEVRCGAVLCCVYIWFLQVMFSDAVSGAALPVR